MYEKRKVSITASARVVMDLLEEAGETWPIDVVAAISKESGITDNTVIVGEAIDGITQLLKMGWASLYDESGDGPVVDKALERELLTKLRPTSFEFSDGGWRNVDSSITVRLLRIKLTRAGRAAYGI